MVVRPARRVVAVALAGSLTSLTAVALAGPAGAAASTTTVTATGSVDAAGTSYLNNNVEVTGTGPASASLDWVDPAADLNIFVKDPSGALIASSLDRTAKPETVGFTASVVGTYKVGVKARVGATDYTLSFTQSGAAPVPGRYTGRVDAAGVAWSPNTYTLDAPATITGHLDWTDATAALSLILKDPTGKVVAASAQKDAKPEEIVFPATKTGNYIFGVKAVMGASDFVLDVSKGAPAPPPPAASTLTYSGTIGGPAHAQMYTSGIDVDAAGNLYIADTGNDEVASFTPSGQLRWRVGTRGGIGPGDFSNPRDVAVVGSRLYVADTDHASVNVVDTATGGNPVRWATKFPSLLGVGAGVDADGLPVVLVAESGTSTIKVVRPDGTVVRSIGKGFGSGPGYLNQARDAATSPNGTIFVADFANNRVAKFAPDGTFVTAWGTGGPGRGSSAGRTASTSTTQDRVYVADSNNGRIQTVRPRRHVPAAPTAPRSGIPPRQRPPVRAAPGRCRWRAAAHGLRRGPVGVPVLRYDTAPGGSPPRLRLGDRPARRRAFNEPYGADADADAVFVAERDNQRIQRLAPTAPWSSRAVGRPGLRRGPPGFNWPRDLTIDAGDRLVWVADTKNIRVQEFTRDGAADRRTLGRQRVRAAPGLLAFAVRHRHAA